MANAMVRKLFKVAKELNLETSTLTEELGKQGFEVTKKQMTPIPDEIYEGLLRKFAPERWANIQEDIARQKIEVKEQEAKAVRDADLQKIIESGGTKTAAKPIPSVRQLEPGDIITPTKAVVIPSAAKSVATGEPKPSKAVVRPGEPLPVEPDADQAVIEVAPSAGDAASIELATEKVKMGTRPSIGKMSVRGGISNEDIKAFEPSPSPPPETAPKAVEKPAPEKPVEEKKDEETKSRRRKRKRKPKRGEVKAEPAPETGVKKEGWVSTGEAPTGKRKRRRGKKKKIDIKEVQAAIKQTMAAMEDHGKKRKKRRVASGVGIVDEETNLLKITEFVSTTDLAQLVDVPVADLIKECLLLGLRVTINQRLDCDTIQLLAEEHDYHVEFVDQVEEEDLIDEEEIAREEGEKVPRAPVVTIMGHVDHGKTSLLDYLRKSHIIDGEAGGITQHIGAYEIEHDTRKITFLDTPGHEAFTAMRARGAQVTDIVVLVISADDQVMPQTVEAIDHARAANVPIVIAINKMDKEGANADKVRRQLADYNLVVEEYGGDILSAEISAKTGMGITDLLDKILLASEMLELTAVRDTSARGSIIESRLDKGRGTICTVLILKGTLQVGDIFVAGRYFGRVRAMFDERGNKRDEVFPGQPIEITGIDSAPHVGDPFIVFDDEKEAKEVASKRQLQLREQEMRLREGFGKVDLLTSVEGEGKRELNLIIKGDVDGSVEAIADSLMRLSTNDVEVKIIHRSVGPINESDVLLAGASNAMIIGFNIHPNLKAREMAQNEGVTFQTYRVIYELIEDIKDILKGMRKRKFVEEVKGTIEVRDIFKISRIGTIAGCYVVNGKVERNNRVRVLRDGISVYEGVIETLKRFKDDAKEVKEGFECGIKVADFNDIKVGDIIEALIQVEVEEEIEVEA